MEEWFDIVKLRAHRGRDTRRGDKIIRTRVWEMLKKMGLDSFVTDVQLDRRNKIVTITANEMGRVIGRRGMNLRQIEKMLKNWTVDVQEDKSSEPFKGGKKVFDLSDRMYS